MRTDYFLLSHVAILVALASVACAQQWPFARLPSNSGDPKVHVRLGHQPQPVLQPPSKQQPHLQPQLQLHLQPYTTAWVNELQAVYNAFGPIKNDSSCPTEIQDWSCRPYPLSNKDVIPPKDVWHLRPHDIKAIMSIGDSISAGFAMVSARPPFATVLEFRGKVFSGGGDDGEYTLTNFLRTYSKGVTGSPSGFTLPLATVFIGANNLCAACGDNDVTGQDIAAPEEYASALKGALQDLRDSVGRVFVNLVGIFDVTLVYDLSRGYPYCEMLFDQAPIPICGCATSNPEDRKKAGDLSRMYNTLMEKIADELNEESKDEGTFGVVFQPGLTEFKSGSSGFGQGYMSGLDW
ncbi:hypothetical protein BGZ94_005089 [Podila epigama]|nr:hypothetical protein BGZ94_005089 [Podila epigama]